MLLIKLMVEKTEIYKLTYNFCKGKTNQGCFRILGKTFFNKNKYIGRIIINNRLKPLKDELQFEDIKKDKLIMKIIFLQKIKNKSCMFKDCISLISIFQKENYYLKKNSIDFLKAHNLNKSSY